MNYPDRQLEVINHVVNVLGGEIREVVKNKSTIKRVYAKILGKDIVFDNIDLNGVPFGISVVKFKEMMAKLATELNMLVAMNDELWVNSWDTKSFSYLVNCGLYNGFGPTNVKESAIENKIIDKYDFEFRVKSRSKLHKNEEHIYRFTLYKINCDIKVDRIIRDNKLENIISYKPNIKKLTQEKVKEFKLNEYRDLFINAVKEISETEYDEFMKMFNIYKQDENFKIERELSRRYQDRVINELNEEYVSNRDG